MEPSEPPFDDEESAPEEVVREAKGAFRRRAPGEKASLVFDSLVDADERPEDHRLHFDHDRFRFEVHVSIGPADVLLSGTVAPPVGGRFEMLLEQGELGFVHDSPDGSFTFGPVGHGLVRLSFEPEDGPRIHTDWFSI